MVRQHKLHFLAAQETWMYPPVLVWKQALGKSCRIANEAAENIASFECFWIFRKTPLGLEIGLIPLSGMGHGRKPAQQ